MYGPKVCHTEWSKSGKGEIPYNIPNVWTLERNDTNKLTYKTEKDWQTENELRVVRGRDRDSGKVMYTIIFKTDNQQRPIV